MWIDRATTATFYSMWLLLVCLFTLTTMQVQAECRAFDPGEKDNCAPLAENIANAENYSYETYYARALSWMETDGESFKARLNSIVRGHTCYQYDPCTWLALEELDEDPHNSNYVIGFYSRKYFEKINRDCGDKTRGVGTNLRDDWNREHVFPAGKFHRDEQMCAYTDLHHLVAADRSLNIRRSDKDFKPGTDLVGSGRKDESGQKGIECQDCRETKLAFEPQDGQKGAVARMLLYVDVRYDGSPEEEQGRRRLETTPDLKLVKVDGNTKSNPIAELGDLCTLLEWHAKFPVTDAERRRNQGVQRWQGNRNPFIDNPGFADKIWGGVDCPDDDIDNDNEVANEDEDEDPVDLGSVGIVAAFVNPPGSSERTGEWVKIKNYGETAIHFKGYTLEDESTRDPFPLSGILEPGATACFQNFSKYIRLLNGGGSLTLKYTTKEDVIDSVQWNRVADGEVVVFNETECDKDCRSPTQCQVEEEATVAEERDL